MQWLYCIFRLGMKVITSLGVVTCVAASVFSVCSSSDFSSLFSTTFSSTEKSLMTMKWIIMFTWLARFSCSVLGFRGFFSVGFLLLYFLDLFFDRCYSLRLFFDLCSLLFLGRFSGIVWLFRFIGTCCFFLLIKGKMNKYFVYLTLSFLSSDWKGPAIFPKIRFKVPDRFLLSGLAK